MPTRTVPWDIDSMIVAPIDPVTDAPGTAVVCRGTVSSSVEVRVKSGEQPGDGGIYAVVSKNIGGTFVGQFADLQDYSVLAVMMGLDPESSGNPNALILPHTTKPFPYFYGAARTYLEDGVGTFHMLMLKMKITSNFSYNIADGGFVLPQFTCTMVPSNYITRNGKPVITVPVRYAADVALAIPPVSVPLTDAEV